LKDNKADLSDMNSILDFTSIMLGIEVLRLSMVHKLYLTHKTHIVNTLLRQLHYYYANLSFELIQAVNLA
jgi:hypothetical protein